MNSMVRFIFMLLVCLVPSVYLLEYVPFPGGLILQKPGQKCTVAWPYTDGCNGCGCGFDGTVACDNSYKCSGYEHGGVVGKDVWAGLPWKRSNKTVKKYGS